MNGRSYRVKPHLDRYVGVNTCLIRGALSADLIGQEVQPAQELANLMNYFYSPT